MIKGMVVAVSDPIEFKGTGTNGIILELEDSSRVFRTNAQFLQDLKRSCIEVNGNFNNAKSKVLGRTLIGNLTWSEAGSTYPATEQSRAVKNGTKKIGDELTREREGYFVNGFLTFLPSIEQLSADAYAERKCELNNTLSILRKGGEEQVA